MNRFLTEKIKNTEEYKPSENIYKIKLDANESPYLPSEKLRRRIAEVTAAVAFDRYPDPAATKLCEAYAGFMGICSDDIVAGNGSDELISVIATSFLSKGDRVLVTIPDFSMYAFYSGIAEAEVITYAKEGGYDIDFDELVSIIKEKNVKLVLLSNPCNPTGVAYDAAVIEDFIRRAGCLVILDEAYMEFCRKPYSLLGKYREFDNLIILKTLSKAVGLAALRCGFAVASPELSSALRKMKSPYNVNSLTQEIAALILTEGADEIKANTEKILSETERLYKTLAERSDECGFALRLPDTNFVLLKFKDNAKAEAIFESLKEKSIIIRHMGRGILRISAGTQEENDALLDALNDLL